MKIAYLYYDFLNLYGESGNIKIIDNVLKSNKIKHEILYLSLDDELDFDSYDLVYIGSGTEENQKIALKHLMNFQYEMSDMELELYVGKLNKEKEVIEEINKLYWLNKNEDFFNVEKFAGEGNIGHMVKQVEIYKNKLFGE